MATKEEGTFAVAIGWDTTEAARTLVSKLMREGVVHVMVDPLHDKRGKQTVRFLEEQGFRKAGIALEGDIYSYAPEDNVALLYEEDVVVRRSGWRLAIGLCCLAGFLFVGALAGSGAI